MDAEGEFHCKQVDDEITVHDDNSENQNSQSLKISGNQARNMKYIHNQIGEKSTLKAIVMRKQQERIKIQTVDMDEVENHAKKQKFIANTYPHTPAKLDEVSNFSRMDDEQLKEEDDEMSSSGDDSDSSQRSGSCQDQISGMKQRKKRRTKNSDDERLFLCGCKKRYLSYAALYTHTKKIHDGVFPEGTLIGSKREPFLSGKSISSIKIKQMLKRSEEDGNTFSKKSRRQRLVEDYLSSRANPSQLDLNADESQDNETCSKRSHRKLLKIKELLQQENSTLKYGIGELSSKKRTSSKRIIGEQTHWFAYFFEWLQKRNFLDLSYWSIFESPEIKSINPNLKSHQKAKREYIENLRTNPIMQSVLMLVPEASKKTCAMISPLNDIVDAYSTIHSYLEALHGDDYILFIEKHVVASAGENFSLDLTFAWYLVLMESKLETAFLRKVIIVFCIVSIYFAPRGFGITRRHSKASKFDFFHGSTEEKNGLLSLGQTCKILNSEFLSDYGNEYVEFWERLKSELKSQHEPDGAKLSEEHCNLRELVQSLSNQEFTYILESFFEFLQIFKFTECRVRLSDRQEQEVDIRNLAPDLKERKNAKFKFGASKAKIAGKELSSADLHTSNGQLMYGEVNQKGHKPMAKESAIFADQNPESKIPGSESYWELIKGYEKLSLKGKDRWIYIFNKLSTIHSQRDPPKNKRKIAGTNETAVGSCKQDATIHDRMIYENQACSLSVSDTDEGLNFT